MNKNILIGLLVGLLALSLAFISMGDKLNGMGKDSYDDVISDDLEGWKTYENDLLGLKFDYPADWKLEGEVLSSAPCFGGENEATVVDLAFVHPVSGGFFVEAVDNPECVNRGLGEFHYAESPSEISYDEMRELSSATFYVAEGTVNPGVDAVHAYLFEGVQVLPSLHFFYNPPNLAEEKEVFFQVLDSMSFYETSSRVVPVESNVSRTSMTPLEALMDANVLSVSKIGVYPKNTEIRIEKMLPEDPNDFQWLKVVIVEDGLADDSVKKEEREVHLKQDANGSWEVVYQAVVE